jgi:hypothetical protein
LIAEKKGSIKSMTAEELDEICTALAATPAAILNVISNLSEEQQRRHSPDGEFSCVENVCHLRDLEVEGYTARINRLLAEERPILPDIDGARLAIERDYNRQDIRQALEVFAVARAENLHSLRALRPEQLGRQGTLEGVGIVTLEEVLLMMRDHDLGHLEDLHRLWQSQAAFTA